MPDDHSILRVAVIGAGRLGGYHAEKYAAMDGVQLVAVCDCEAARAGSVAAKTAGRAVTDYKAIDGVDAVSIAVPTVSHHEVAAHFVDRGVHVLVEKPITTTVDEARDLVARARDRGVKLQVGHIERFNPALVAALPFIEKPLFIEVHRIAPFSFRSVDIGVIMDLMIHDLDILLHLTESPIRQILANGACVITGNEDIAAARIEFENGCVANLTASRLGLKHERKFRIFQHMCYISLDFLAREGNVVMKGEGFDKLDLDNIDPEIIEDPLQFLTRNLVEMHPLKAPPDADGLRDELTAFLDAIRKDENPLVTGEHGLRAIETAERIKAQAVIVTQDAT